MTQIEQPTLNVINNDCIETMKSMPPNIVKVCVTSPPYNIGKKYDKYKDTNPDYFLWLGEVFKELSRVIRDDGHFFLNIGWTTKSFDIPYMVLDEARKHFSLQNNIIWVKHIKINNNTHGQYRPSTSDYHLSNTWEHVFHLTKNKTVIDSTNFVGEYEIGLWNSEEDKTKLHAYRARRRISKNMGFTTLNEAEKSEIFKQKVAEYLEQKPYQHKEQKDEGAVWYIPYEPVSREFNTSDHPAIFPVALPENCILMASDEGDLVYDPFSGSFTTGVAAIKTRRSFVGTELSPDYCKFGTKRLEQAINQFQSKSNIVQTTTWI